jgi:MFS family permease
VAVALPIAAQLIATAGWRWTSLVFIGSCLVGVAFVWLMTSGPAIVVPAEGSKRGRAGSADAGVASAEGAPTAPSNQPRRVGEPISAGQLSRRGAASDVAARASGLRESSAPGAIAAAHEIPPSGSGDHRHSVRRTVRTRRFWILFGGAVAIGIFDEGVLQAFIPAAVHGGVALGTAAAALGTQSLAYVIGQVAGGWLSDRVGRRIVGLVAALVVGGGVIAAIGLVAVLPALAVIGIALHGVGTGATIAVRSAAFGDVFGGANFGTIFGLLAVAYPIGGAVAVYLGAVLVDATGSYELLVPFILVAVAIWAVALWIAGPRRSRGPRPLVPST